MQPVLHDSGGRSETGCSQECPVSPAPRPLRAGRAFGAGRGLLRTALLFLRRSTAEEQVEAAEMRTPSPGRTAQEPRRKIGRRPQANGRGTPGNRLSFPSSGSAASRVTLTTIARAGRIARAMNHVRSSSSGGAKRRPEDLRTRMAPKRHVRPEMVGSSPTMMMWGAAALHWSKGGPSPRSLPRVGPLPSGRGRGPELRREADVDRQT
jgi:hypothetical protein